MKKRLTAFIFLIVMLVGLLGTVTVQADTVTVEDFDSVYEEAFCQGYLARVDDGIGYKLQSGDTFGVPICYTYLSGSNKYVVLDTCSFKVTDSSAPLYGVFLRSNWCLFPVLISTSAFDIDYTFCNKYYKRISDSGVSCTNSDLLYAVNQSFKCRQYRDFYYAPVGGGILGEWLEYTQITFPTYDLSVTSSSPQDDYIKSFIDSYLAGTLSEPTVRGEDGEDISVSDIPSSSTYNPDLGYLQNIMCTTLVDKTNVTNTSNEYAGEKRYKFSYGLTTSTGFDLRTAGADVQYCIKIKGGYTTLLNDYVSLPTVVSDYFKVGNGVSYFYIDADTFNDLYTQFRTDASLMAKTIDSQIYIYMRPISSTGFGGWSRIKFDKGNIQVSNLHIDNGTTSDGDISAEPDGEEDDFKVESSTEGNSAYGEGNGFDDAESNASVSGTNSSNTNFDDYDAEAMFSQIKSLVSQIGQIPMIIGEIFSFLPSWCLVLVSVGFALIVFLIIYKLIRG